MANNGILSLSPLARDWLKVVAFASMVADHAAIVFGWQAVWLHMVGRAAMPLFALVWGANMAGRIISPSGLARLWGWALIAQPCFWLVTRHAGSQWYELNVLFLFAVSGQVLYGLMRRTAATLSLAMIAVFFYVPLSTASYGVRGILLILASWTLFVVPPRWFLPAFISWLIAVLVLNLPNGIPMVLAGLCLPLLAVGLCLHYLQNNRRRITITRYFAPAYGLHLALLAVMAST